MTGKSKHQTGGIANRSELLRDGLAGCIAIVVIASNPSNASEKSADTYGPKVVDLGNGSPDESAYLKEESKPVMQVNAEAEPFPVNQVKWGPGRGPIEAGDPSAGELQIWDITGSTYRKVIRLKVGEYYDNGANDFSSPVITLYIEAGTRGIINVPVGSYEVLGMSGGQWNGNNFGDETTAVTFGRFEVTSKERTILAIGAIDQQIKPIPIDRF